mmetsp:Transcript_36619/g.91807  ORF Transcript_36619/g.91807 Transcript_36619/m.91807 type:complete len:257 (+) Transcript_36619:321-1091(+)
MAAGDEGHFSFQMLSDVHLEFNPAPEFEALAPNLILAGDIGNPKLPEYRNFLLAQAERFQRVFVVTGNHEYYRSYHAEADRAIHTICDQHDALHFLNMDRVDLSDSVCLLGCTLWSAIPSKAMADVTKMTDFRQIQMESDDSYSPKYHNSFHMEHVAWLKAQLKFCKKRKMRTVVITHHAPLLECMPEKYRTQPLRYCYYTDMSKLMGKTIMFWGYGHTHTPFDKIVKGTRVASNPIGYSKEKVEWKRDCVYQVPL